MLDAIARLSAFGRALKETGESYSSINNARCVIDKVKQFTPRLPKHEVKLLNY